MSNDDRYIPHSALEFVRQTEDGLSEHRYRGARLVSGAPKHPTYNVFYLDGHPHTGLQRGQLLECQRIIDWWLDHGGVPDPYVWLGKPKSQG